jgi:hypothetical protein
MTKINNVGGPLRGLRYKVEIIESATQSGGEDRVLSTTEMRDLISGVPEELNKPRGPTRKAMHPIKVRFTALDGDPTLVTEALIAFRLRRPVARATIQD